MKEVSVLMTHAVKIMDSNNKPIGELMTASDTDILKYLQKGFVVIDTKTGAYLTEESITNELGMSDGVIMVG